MTDMALPPLHPPARRGPLREYRERFTALPAPALDSLAGRYRGQFVGPLWLRLLARPLLALLGMPGWWGKEFTADGRGVNLVRRGGALRPSVPVGLCNGPSRVDGRWGVQVEYPPEASWQWRLFVDELRWTSGSTLLVQTHLRLPLVGQVTLPLLLHRVDAPA